jgi:hypothetical protein
MSNWPRQLFCRAKHIGVDLPETMMVGRQTVHMPPTVVASILGAIGTRRGQASAVVEASCRRHRPLKLTFCVDDRIRYSERAIFRWLQDKILSKTLTQLCIRGDVNMITYMSSGWPAPFASTQSRKTRYRSAAFGPQVGCRSPIIMACILKVILFASSRR